MRLLPMLLLSVTALLLAGCAKENRFAPSSEVAGMQGRPGSMLAYEHNIRLRLAAEQLPARMEAVQSACLQERFGACSLLRFEHADGSSMGGTLVLRSAVAAVEPLVALAGEGGHVEARETRAEDLAEAVADTAAELERLQLQIARLKDFEARPDLAVADMLALAREGAATQARIADLQREAANQQRRIETNLLTLRFLAVDQSSRWSRVRSAPANALESLLEGTADVAELLAYGLPYLLLAFPLALLWRSLWRRATTRRQR